jgi:hypothetical protein
MVVMKGFGVHILDFWPSPTAVAWHGRFGRDKTTLPFTLYARYTCDEDDEFFASRDGSGRQLSLCIRYDGSGGWLFGADQYTSWQSMTDHPRHVPAAQYNMQEEDMYEAELVKTPPGIQAY